MVRFSVVLLPLLVLRLSAVAQTERIRVYFNRETDPSVSTGTLAISLFNATDDTIEAYIDRAQYTIDVAVYNANDYSIISALNQARNRGVQVRYIAEGSNSNTALANLSPAIPRLYRSDGQGSGMHNKFMSIDADHADLAWVWTGSTNWTQNGLFEDYNNMVFIQDQALALAYRAEFEEMWGGPGPLPNAGNSRFGADKNDNTQHFFEVDGVTIECRFSPSDGTTARIVNAINGAAHSVHAALFAFTNSSIGSALLAAHQRPDTQVRIDQEDAVTPGTQAWTLRSNGVDVASHTSDQVQLHHKYGIIDALGGDDPMVITGSHNWTNFAETLNDENTLIIHDASVANLFYQEWSARRNEVTGVDASLPAAPRLEVTPAIATDAVNVHCSGAALLVLHDAMGRVFHSASVPGGMIRLDLRGMPDAPYTLTAFTEAGRACARFVVAH